MNTLVKSLALGASLLAATTATQAKILWSEVSISVLQGSEYHNPFIDDEGAGTVVTLEHAGAYNWGKSFAFMDKFITGDKDINGDDTYIELGADISVNWMGQTQVFDSAITKDFFVATQVEQIPNAGGANQDNLLIGAGVRWKVPLFVFLDTNLYARFNEDRDPNQQLTVAWLLPFEIATAKLEFTGFVDYATQTKRRDGSTYEAEWQTQPQLLLDVGHFGGQSGQYYVGLEYQHWENKFGIKGQTQSLPQIMAKVKF